jgi:hypothetical protein
MGHTGKMATAETLSHHRSVNQRILPTTRDTSIPSLLQFTYTVIVSQSPNRLSTRRTKARANTNSHTILYSRSLLQNVCPYGRFIKKFTPTDQYILFEHITPHTRVILHYYYRQLLNLQPQLYKVHFRQPNHSSSLDNTQRSFGGGGINDEVVSISSTEKETSYADVDWKPFPHNPALQLCSNPIHKNRALHWTPNHPLVFQPQTHQLLQTFTLSEISELKQICQGTQNTAIIRHTHDHNIFISTKDIQHLVSHGKVTYDNTMILYIKMMNIMISHTYTPTSSHDFAMKDGVT